MSQIEVYGNIQTAIPRDLRQSVDISCPGAGKVAALSSMAGQSHHEIRRRLAELGVEPARGDEQKAAEEARQVAAISDGFGSAPVRLIPNILRAKPGYADHLLPFQAGHEPALLAFGARDAGQNLWKTVAVDGGRRTLISMPGEDLSSRQYFVLYSLADKPGHLAIGRARFDAQRIRVEGESGEISFAVTGAPLAIGGVAVPTATRIGYQADLRHEFRVSPPRWEAVLAELQPLLFASPDPTEAGRAVLRRAGELGLSVENGYWLESVGVGPDGQLNLISGRMSASEAAEHQLAMGSVGAILTQEGGSCGYAVWECAKDFKRHDQVMRDATGKPVWELAPRFFGMSTYFRPSALTLCIIKLKSFLIEPPFRSA